MASSLGNVTVIVATEALLDSAGPIVELTLAYLALPCHVGIYRGIRHPWICEFHYYGGRSFELSLFRKPSDMGYICLRNNVCNVRQRHVSLTERRQLSREASTDTRHATTDDTQYTEQTDWSSVAKKDSPTFKTRQGLRAPRGSSHV